MAVALGFDAPVVERDGRGLAGPDQAGDHAPGDGLAGREAVLAQAPLPAVERRPGAAGRLQGGRLGRALKAKLVEQRELVEALGGLRRKFVADRVEAIKFAVRMFDLHGAFSRLSAFEF